MHQKANDSCLQEGIQILALANRAWELYEKQEMAEKRRLLDYVCSNSIWKDGKLLPNYRKPFDLILDVCELATERKGNAGSECDETAQNEIWLPELDVGTTWGGKDTQDYSRSQRSQGYAQR